MRHSFRMRLALSSVGISGLVLMVFALSAWQFSHRFGLRQLDREMAESLGPILVVSHPAAHWSWIADGLNMRYGSEGDEGCLVLVKGANGKVLLRSGNWPEALATETFAAPNPANLSLRPPPVPPAPVSPRRAGQSSAPAKGSQPAGNPPAWRFLSMSLPETTTRRIQGRNWRVCVQQNEEVTFVLGVSLARLESEMARVSNAFVAALPAALLLIGAGSWLASGRALRSVATLADVTEQVTASSLDQRLAPESVETEFRRLITVFNGMLDRLERSFSQAVRFSADAAHEFRTPLTILQGQIEQAIQRAPAGSEQQEVYNGLLEEVQRLKSIAQKLLLLAQADAGQLRPALERVSLTELVDEAAEDAQALAPELTVTALVSPGVHVMADRDLLRQALSNLSSNAARYNRAGGTISLQLTTSEGWGELAVTNTGPGIPADDQGRLFERFYRADPARGRRVDGIGLGLSIAREIVRAHGGDLVLVESGEDRTTFRMRLPVAGPGDP
jgi:two-component system, OmpR family, heavy metal sensor histidine kinase CusS